jgi:SAM-dependent methyltransferase
MSTDYIAGWQGAAHDWDRRQRWGMNFLVTEGRLAPTDHLLDLGCGPLCLGSKLIAYLDTGHYTGVDRDATLLGAGKALVTRKGLDGKTPTLLCTQDLTTADCGRSCDVFWSHSVFIHMDPATVVTALDFLARHLADTGTAYFTMNLGPHKILGEWWCGPNYQHPMPEHPALAISVFGSLTDMGDVVWCPPGSGMQATMLQATRRASCRTTAIAN